MPRKHYSFRLTPDGAEDEESVPREKRKGLLGALGVVACGLLFMTVPYTILHLVMDPLGSGISGKTWSGFHPVELVTSGIGGLVATLLCVAVLVRRKNRKDRAEPS